MTTFEKKKNYFEPFLGLKNRRTLLLPNISGCPRLLEWHPLDLMFKDPIEDSFAKNFPHTYSRLPKNSHFSPGL